MCVLYYYDHNEHQNHVLRVTLRWHRCAPVPALVHVNTKDMAEITKRKSEVIFVPAVAHCCCCGSRCLRFCRGRCVAELEKAEYCCPNDARRSNEGEAVDEGNKAEVHHVQRDPDYGHRCGIFHKVVLVVVPGLYPQVTPIFEEKDRRSGKRQSNQDQGKNSLVAEFLCCWCVGRPQTPPLLSSRPQC